MAFLFHFISLLFLEFVSVVPSFVVLYSDDLYCEKQSHLGRTTGILLLLY